MRNIDGRTAWATRTVVASASDWKVFRVSGTVSTAQRRVPPSAIFERSAGATSAPASGLPEGSSELHPARAVTASAPAVRKVIVRRTARGRTPSWDISGYLRKAAGVTIPFGGIWCSSDVCGHWRGKGSATEGDTATTAGKPTRAAQRTGRCARAPRPIDAHPFTAQGVTRDTLRRMNVAALGLKDPRK